MRSSMYQNYRRLKPDARINITPFVDVALVLMIVFMITAPLLTTSIPLTLPTANGVSADATAPLVISITADGSIFINNSAIERTQLKNALESYKETLEPETAVFVRADDGLNYGVFVEVLSVLRRANFQRLSIVSLPESDDSPTL